MGRAKQKERERKRSAASCQRLDIHFQKKSKVVEEEVITIDADISASDDVVWRRTPLRIESKGLVKLFKLFLAQKFRDSQLIRSNDVSHIVLATQCFRSNWRAII